MALVIRDINAVGRKLSARVRNIFSVRRHNLERRAFQGIVRRLVTLFYNQRSGRTVVEIQRLRRARFNENGFRRSVQNITVRRSDFFRGNRHARSEIFNHDPPVFIGNKFAVGIPNGSAGLIRDKECHAFDRRRASGYKLLNRQRFLRRVPEYDFFCFAAENLHALRRGIQNITGYCFGFAYIYGHARLQIFHADFAVFIGIIRPVSDCRAARVRNLKLDAGQRRVVRSLNIFVNYERGQRLIVESQRIVPAEFNPYGLRTAVKRKSIGASDFAYRYRKSGFQIGDKNPTVFVRRIFSVSDRRAVGVHDLERHAGNRRRASFDVFLNRQCLNRDVVEYHALRRARFDKEL